MSSRPLLVEKLIVYIGDLTGSQFLPGLSLLLRNAEAQWRHPVDSRCYIGLKYNVDLMEV